jgi:hypothetical protein
MLSAASPAPRLMLSPPLRPEGADTADAKGGDRRGERYCGHGDGFDLILVGSDVVVMMLVGTVI